MKKLLAIMVFMLITSVCLATDNWWYCGTTSCRSCSEQHASYTSSYTNGLYLYTLSCPTCHKYWAEGNSYCPRCGGIGWFTKYSRPRNIFSWYFGYTDYKFSCMKCGYVLISGGNN